MILLLGGTHETALFAADLARGGYSVLVSMATEVPLTLPKHPLVRCRRGPLDAEGLAALIIEDQIAGLVVATHPYAREVRSMAQAVAAAQGIPVFVYDRPSHPGPSGQGVHSVPSHDAAAALAVRFRRPILSTVGTRNLEPYVRAATQAKVSLIARILDSAPSWMECERLGLRKASVIAARGPFSVEANLETLRAREIGVLVSKDGGQAGGLPEKLEAARRHGCEVVLVTRPPSPEKVWRSRGALCEALGRAIPRTGSNS